MRPEGDEERFRPHEKQFEADEELLGLWWGEFDQTSADLVRAKRRLRGGEDCEREVAELRLKLGGLRLNLESAGERPDPAEPGDVARAATETDLPAGRRAVGNGEEAGADVRAS